MFCRRLFAVEFRARQFIDERAERLQRGYAHFEKHVAVGVHAAFRHLGGVGQFLRLPRIVAAVSDRERVDVQRAVFGRAVDGERVLLAAFRRGNGGHAATYLRLRNGVDRAERTRDGGADAAHRKENGLVVEIAPVPRDVHRDFLHGNFLGPGVLDLDLRLGAALVVRRRIGVFIDVSVRIRVTWSYLL